MKFQNKQLSYLKEDEKAKVCVIGAGAAGICSIKNLIQHLKYFEIDAYEYSGSIGGTWVYTDRIGQDENGFPIHSSMYKNLKTNIPLNVMEYPDFRAEEDGENFVKHDIVLNYLESYAKHFDVEKYIHFFHRVKLVKKRDNGWEITIVNLNTKQEFVKIFDVVMVCIGRYSKPYFPKSIDTSKFKGLILHSHEYRDPARFKDQNVVVLGAGPSGIDIALELINNSKNIFLLHSSVNEFEDIKKPLKQIRSGIKQILKDSVILDNGCVLENIQTILFATGYDLDFEIFHENVGIKNTPKGLIENIYLHFLNSLHPTMCFFAIPQRILPFPMYHEQSCWFIQHLLGAFEIPSKKEMDEWCKLDYKKRLESGYKPRQIHKMVTEDELWDYEKLITEQAKIPRIKPVVRDIYNNLHKLRNKNANSYKKTRFYIKNDEEFVMKE